ncbi:MAG: penicillin-binding protein 2 [Actinomycetota bacterium]
MVMRRWSDASPAGSEAESAGRRFRISLVSLVVASFFVTLLARLWFLQVLADSDYARLSERNRVRLISTDAPRGRILDRNGQELVKNRPAWAVRVSPQELVDREGELGRLADLLGMPRADLDRRLKSVKVSPYNPVPVKEDVPLETVLYLNEHKEEYPGIDAEVLPLRKYVMGQTAAHLLGYVNEISEVQLEDPAYAKYRAGDLAGQAGVELTHEADLRGTPGLVSKQVNARGEVIGEAVTVQEEVAGNDLVLTIDAGIQQVAEESLAQAMANARLSGDRERGGNYTAPGGAAVVLDPTTGEVLALASLPAYDPEKFVGGILPADYAAYRDDPARPLIGRAIQSVYPPGSTFKPITAAAALSAGVITPTMPISCPGSYKFGGRTFSNWKQTDSGSMGLTEALAQSCDTYFYEIGSRFWSRELAQDRAKKPIEEKIQAMARGFGFGTRTGIDLPFEQKGLVPDRAWRRAIWDRTALCKAKDSASQRKCRESMAWQGGNNLNISIGQGDLQVSPLQMAVGYAAIANGGTLYRPYVGMKVVSPAGETVKKANPQVAGKLPIDAPSLEAIQEGLVAATVSGTARGAFYSFPIDRFPVASKTGTAEIAGRAPFAWFASYAPADNPAYVVVVMIEEAGHGGEVAAPVARRIYQSLFGLTATDVASCGICGRD